MVWDSWVDYVKAVYGAQVAGIIDPRLKPTDADNWYFTQKELDRMEELAEKLLTRPLPEPGEGQSVNEPIPWREIWCNPVMIISVSITAIYLVGLIFVLAGVLGS